MKIIQLRNATVILEIGAQRILVDPMLARKGALPPLRLQGGRQRNPTVELPETTLGLLDTVTHCLITHCQKGHFDHLDRAAAAWLRATGTPVICTPHDAPFLHRRGLNICPLPDRHHEPQAFPGGHIRSVPCVHGTGLVGMLMEHGVGYFIESAGEPSLYLCGDTRLTPAIRDFIARQQPDIVLAPAGGARFDIGNEIIMDIREILELTRLSRGLVVANHLEALSHCPVRRPDLQAAAVQAGLQARLRVPEDGETLELVRETA